MLLGQLENNTAVSLTTPVGKATDRDMRLAYRDLRLTDWELRLADLDLRLTDRDEAG